MARLLKRARWIAARNARAGSVIVLSALFLLLAIFADRSKLTAKTEKDPASIRAFSFAGASGPKLGVPIPNYTITSSTGAEIVPGDTDIGNHCDDCTTGITLPFPIILYDQVFSSAVISSNGTLQFASNITAFGNGCLPGDNGQTFSYTIFPYWDDLYTARDDLGEGIFTSVSGSASTRIFNIEWRAEHCRCNGCGIRHRFDVRFYAGPRTFH